MNLTEVNEREEKMEELRTLFLKGGRGKHKLLKQLFTSSEFYTEQPFVLIQQVYARLGIQKEDFNEDSFRRWLKRNRMKSVKANLSIAIAPKIETPTTFKFTNPSSLKKSDEPLIKIVK